MANVLITGANGGFGKPTVETLAKSNHTVVASMRGIDGKNKATAEEFNGLGVRVVEMDVTREQSVNSAISRAIEESGGLDVVVNNAGVGVLGVQETFTTADWQRLFDVNVFGVQRVNRAVLPHMRDRRSGYLMQVSSLLGRVTIPFYGPYNASKWALEAMSENYRVELSRFGIDVGIVEPGGYPTSFMHALMRPSDQTREGALGPMQQEAQAFFEGFEKAMASNPAQDIQNVADAIVKLIETPAGERPFRTVVDKMGMGDAIQPYNEKLEEVTNGMYGALGMGQMLELQLK